MARQIDLGDISKLAEDELEELVIFAAKVWEGQVKEKTPVDTGDLRGRWRQVKISKTRIEIQNNLPYAEPVVYGKNLPPSWQAFTVQGRTPRRSLATQTFWPKKSLHSKSRPELNL